MVKEVELRGHAFERANICAGCREQLAGRDGHYHTREAYGGGVEPICCACAGVHRERPRAVPEPAEAESELLVRVLAAVEGCAQFKVGDVWKILGGGDSVWYAVKKLFQTSGRFEQVSKQCWKVRV
jgi:hypothetical protein